MIVDEKFVYWMDFIWGAANIASYILGALTPLLFIWLYRKVQND